MNINERDDKGSTPAHKGISIMFGLILVEQIPTGVRVMLYSKILLLTNIPLMMDP